MKIKNLNLVSYGKFENKEIILSDGLNIIKGSNEAGKSTVLSFIKAMLFGFSGRGSIAANDRKHYLPWGKTTLSGTAEILLDNGKCIKLSRTSGKSQGFDKIECFDTSNGDEYSYVPENEVLCGEDAFLKTLCIRQLQSSISGEDDEISKKLINFLGSGSEDINAQKSESIISDYMKKFKALRGEKGKIFDLQNEIAEINLKIADAENQRLLSFEKIKEKKSLQDKIKQCKEQLAFIKKNQESAKSGELFERLDSLLKSKMGTEGEIASLKEEIATLSDVASTLSAFQNDAPEEIFTPLIETDSLNDEILSLSTKIKNSKLFTFVFAILSLICLGLFFVFKPLVFADVLFLPATIFFAAKTVGIDKNIKKVESVLEKTNAQNDEILKALNFYGVADLKEYAEKKAKFTSVVNEIDMLTQSLKNAEDKLLEITEEIKVYEEKTRGIERAASKYSAAELLEEERDLTIILEDAISRSSHIDGFLSAAENEEETPDVLVSMRNEKCAELDCANEEYEAASLALSAASEVFATMRSDFTPLVNKKASDYLEKLTVGSLDKIYIDKKFSVTAEKDGVFDLSYFSLGTYDQTYLAIRLAVIDLLFENKKPIFIDDAFLQYDKKRESSAFRLLQEKAEAGQQIVFFTCRDIPDFLKNANIIDLDNLK